MARSDFRKTARKQRVITDDERPFVTLRFTLPDALAFAVAPGKFGYCVETLDGGKVQVRTRSDDTAFAAAASYLQTICYAGLTPFSMRAHAGSTGTGKVHAYEIVVIDGNVICVRTSVKPRLHLVRR